MQCSSINYFIKIKIIFFINLLIALNEKKITRSLDSWSGGLSETETSILKAYRDLIQKAEHYIVCICIL